MQDYLILPLIGVLSAMLTWVIRRYARRNLLDMPNERSSHTVPTPRGGGLAIVIAFTVGVLVYNAENSFPPQVVAALLIGGWAVAIIGFIDDRRPVSWRVRALVHFGAAIFGLAALGGMPPLNLGVAIVEWGWIGHIVGVIGIVWLINLYNFMDGIDGLAAGEAVTVALAGGFVVRIGTTPDEMGLIGYVVAFASFGFLIFNWSSASIFMGDVGSGFLGYLFAIFVIYSVANASFVSVQSYGVVGLTFWVWLILLGYFIVDATFTLIRRLLRGDKWYAAHRTHAYQKWLIRGASHRRVTTTILAINVLWLTPLAVMATIFQQFALLFTVIALAPLVFFVADFKAGAPNTEPSV